jgi:NAD(P)H-dependent FMN reductase
MEQIVIISGSIRKRSQTLKISKYLHNFILEKYDYPAVLVDLKKYNFPIFNERFHYIENPSDEQIEFRNIIKDASHIIIVCPAYNLSLPAAVKNIIDFLTEEWKGKTVGFTTISEGTFGAKNVWEDLSKIMTHLKASPMGTGMLLPSVQNYFDENEAIADPISMEKHADAFVKKLVSD